MKGFINLQHVKAISNVAYESPETQVYEIGIENSILSLSGGGVPGMGYDDGEMWS